MSRSMTLRDLTIVADQVSALANAQAAAKASLTRQQRADNPTTTQPEQLFSANTSAGENATLTFDLTFSHRRSLAVIVNRNGRVHIRAPWQASVKDIACFLVSKTDWIRQQQEHFLQLALPQPLTYTAGSEMPYLGRYYPLIIREASVTKVTLQASSGFQVCCRQNDTASIKKALETWYRQQSKAIFHSRFQALTQQLGLDQSHRLQLKIRKMRRRWGSCRQDGVITLNLELIKAPLVTIDYVIVHELCHLFEFNHSAAFYRRLTQYMPDWQEAEQTLQSFTFE